MLGQTSTAGEIEPQNNSKDDADLPGWLNDLPSSSIKNVQFTAQIGLASNDSSFGDKDYYIIPVGSSQPSKVRVNVDADDGSGLNSIQFEVRRRSDDFLFFAENSDESSTSIRQSFEETYNVLGESYLLLYGATEGHEYKVTTYWVENSPMEGELEPNDSRAEAIVASTHNLNKLPVSEPWQGNLSTTTDVDWFYFDADASTINIKFRAEQPDRDGCPKRCGSVADRATLKLTLYDDNGNLLTTKTSDPGLESEQEQFTYTIQELNKGRHWIKVETPSGYSFSNTGPSSDSWAHKTYSITVDYTPLSSTISASSNGGGTISPSSVAVEHGQRASFTVTPSTGYEINSVSGCNGSLNGNTYTTGTISGPCTISASFQSSSGDTGGGDTGGGDTGGGDTGGGDTGGGDTGGGIDYSQSYRYEFYLADYDGGKVRRENSPVSWNVSSTGTAFGGEVITLVFEPNPGYTITASQITGTCGGSFDPSALTFTTDPFTTDCRLDIEFVPEGADVSGPGNNPTVNFSRLLESVLNNLATNAGGTSQPPSAKSPSQPVEKSDLEEDVERDAHQIPALPMLGIFILSGLLGLIGTRRLELH